MKEKENREKKLRKIKNRFKLYKLILHVYSNSFYLYKNKEILKYIKFLKKLIIYIILFNIGFFIFRQQIWIL